MPLINCEINLQLKWSRNCTIVAGTVNNQNPSLQINDTKLYVPVVTLSTQENINLLKQLQSGFERTINWNKYLAKTTNQAQNRYLYYLIGPSFQGVNRLFALSFKDDDGLEGYKQFYFPTLEIKDYNDMIDGRNFFDQPIKKDLKIYGNITKIVKGQGDDYTTGTLKDYPYIKKYYKLVAIDLSKQQKLDADPKATYQINFNRNIDIAEGSTMFFIIEEDKETVLDFWKGAVKVLWFYFFLI